MPTAAYADERVCRGSLGAATVDGLRVPSGASCTLTGTVVKGQAATITGTRLNGDIQLDEQTRALRVDRNTVGGSIQVVKNTGGVAVNGNTVDGNRSCPPT